MANFFADKRVVVTGGAGFLGRCVVRKLQERGCRFVLVPRRASCDLRKWESISHLLEQAQPELVIHLAGVVTGIGGMQANAGRIFYDNLIMGVQLMEAARKQGVKKLVALGSVCSYPKLLPLPGREADLWNGFPEETNGPYGIAKKVVLVQSQAYRQQYGFNSICLIAANLYGPGNHFESGTSHVIPALIHKFSEAVREGHSEVVCWGDGTPTREFLFVEDCAEAILLATEFYNESDPVNLGSGVEISIWDLAHLIAQLVDFQGRIVWDTSKPNGQPRRLWDVSQAEQAFGFRARKPLVEGLAETIAWYQQHAGQLETDEKDHFRVLEHP